MSERAECGRAMTKAVQIKLVLSDWLDREGRSIRDEQAFRDLISGRFVDGATFDATISLDAEAADDLAEALRDGFSPVLWILRKKS